RLAGHRRDDDGDLMARVYLAFHMARHIVNTFQIGDRGAAELHDDASHADLYHPFAPAMKGASALKSRLPSKAAIRGSLTEKGIVAQWLIPGCDPWRYQG